ncbi:MAG: YceI family protein [Bacteroidales bacterium]|jgi:hypothetical protein|nr:YceI family protein [Bacteroidales bacterium]HOI31876.1 YceI family protein [Bacteroidales bacterium]
MKYLFLVFFVLIQCFAIGQQSVVFTTENGSVDFVSDAPLELIKAGSSSLKGALDTTNNAVLFIIENRTFHGFNSPLQQEHFHENYMESKKYPKSIFRARIIEPLQWKSGTTQNIRAKGILDIHGIEQERILDVTLQYLENQLNVTASFEVALDDHKIRIPKVVSKKIAPLIRVNINAELKMITKN